jgi:hypothetical protein
MPSSSLMEENSIIVEQNASPVRAHRSVGCRDHLLAVVAPAESLYPMGHASSRNPESEDAA